MLPARLCTTAITESELRFGLAIMARCRRQAELAVAIEGVFQRVVSGRVLPFDRADACAYAEFGAARQRAVRRVGTADLQIAAIARARNVEAIATRNTPDFDGCGVPLINPWQPGL
jgi:predicted nucleic acid-binding protein